MTVGEEQRLAAALRRRARSIHVEPDFDAVVVDALSGTPQGRRRHARAVATATIGLVVAAAIAIFVVIARQDSSSETATTGPAAESTPVPVESTSADMRYVKLWSASPGQTILSEQWFGPDGAVVALVDMGTDAAPLDDIDPGVEPIAERVPPAQQLPFGYADTVLSRDPIELESQILGPQPGRPQGLYFAVANPPTPDGSMLTRNGLVARQLGNLLPTVFDPEVRAAAFDMVGSLDEATVRGGSADDLGRPATQVTVPVPIEGGAAVQYDIWFGPDNQMLQERWTQAHGSTTTLIVVESAETGAPLPPVAQPSGVDGQLPAQHVEETAAPVFTAAGSPEEVVDAYLDDRFHDRQSLGIEATPAGVYEAGGTARFRWAWSAEAENPTPWGGFIDLRSDGGVWSVVGSTTDGLDLSGVRLDERGLTGPIRSTSSDAIFVDVLDPATGAPINGAVRPDGYPGADFVYGTAAGEGHGHLDLDLTDVPDRLLLRVSLVGGTTLGVSEVVMDRAVG